MKPNFHPNVFWVKIRTRGSQASNCVRIFTQFTTLEWSYAIGEKDVNPKHLQAAAELLTLHRDVIRVIDAKGSIEEDKGQSEAKTSEAKEPNSK
jgi:hypothetical protein